MASIVRVDNMHPAVISVSGRTADQVSPGPFTRLGVGVTIVIVVSVIAAQFVNYGFLLPVLAAVFVCLAVLARADPGAGRAVADPVIGAGLLLLLCSFLLHVFGRRLLLDLGFSDSAGLAYQVKAAVKHGTEVAGWFLIALGLLRLRSGPGRRREVR